MVSPPDKNGGEIGTDAPSFYPGAAGVNGALISPTGDRLAYLSAYAFAGSVTGGIANAYLADRSNAGWASAAVMPKTAAAQFPTAPYTARASYFSTDLSKAVVETNADPVTGMPTGRADLYLRDNATGTYRRLTPEPVTGPFDYVCGDFTQCDHLPIVVSQTPDLSHVLIASRSALTPNAVGVDGVKGYVIDTATGTVQLATVTGETPGIPAAGGLETSAASGSIRQMSADGRYVFFTASTTGRLYRRDLVTGTSVQVDAYEGVAETPGVLLAVFQDASVDGRYAYFTADERLVPDDRNTGEDVYRWDGDAPSGHRLALVSQDEEPADGDAGLTSPTVELDPSGVIASSEDGRTVYFAGTGKLVQGQPGGDGYHVYGWRDGVVSYVGTRTERGSILAGYSREAQFVSIDADGDRLAFESEVPFLPGLSTPSGCPGAGADQADRVPACYQVYLYDATRSTPRSPDLRCVSCPSDSSTALGPTGFRGAHNGRKWHFSRDPVRVVAQDGRVFFESRTRLVPEDVNTKRDVYTYKDGVVDLVSTGRSDKASYLLAATPDGRTVAFATTEPISSRDRDDRYDAYVARLGGGFAEPPVAERSCDGNDECRQPAAAPPAPPVLGSQAFTGAPGLAPGRAVRFALVPVTRAQRAVLARTGRMPLRVRVSAPGTVSVVARATFGGRTRLVGRAARQTQRPGTVAVLVGLSRQARRELARSRRLAVVLQVRFGSARTARTLTLRLTSAGTPAREGRGR